jgi:hypothetical protein
VETARRFFNGEIAPNEMVPAMRKLGSAYYHRLSPLLQAREMVLGLRMKIRPEAFSSISHRGAA